MSVGAVPLDDEEELPGGPPVPPQAAPPPVAMVPSPVGPIPANTPGLPPPDQGAPPPADLTPAPGAPSPGTGAAVAGAPAAGTSPPPAAGALPPLPPRPTRPPLTGDPAKDIENNLGYVRDLESWHEERYARATQQQNDILGKKADQELKLQQEEAQRRAAEEAAYQQRLAQQRQDIADHTTARAAEIGDIESGKWRADKSAGGKIVSILSQVLGGIGAGLSAAGGHPTGNLGQQAIDRVMDREYAHMQDRVNNENQAIQQARFGYRDAEDNHRAALNDLDADMAAKYKLVASDAESQMRARGVSPEQIQQNEIVTGSLQKAAQYEDQIHAREIEAHRKAEIDQSTIARNNAQAESAEALAGYRRGRTHVPGSGGGGGGSKAIDAMNAAAKAGGSVGDIEAAGVAAGMSRKEALAQAKAMTAGHGKGGGAGGVDESKIVHDMDGSPLGLAPSGRGGAAAIQSDIRTMSQALDQLQKLRNNPGLTTRSPEFHDAVLALAAVTTAGKTDTTTHHEEGTLTDFFGMPKVEAIEAKYEQLKKRLTAEKKQLTPLPEGYKARTGGGGGDQLTDKQKQAIEMLKGHGYTTVVQ